MAQAKPNMETKETSEFTFSPTGEPDQLWVLSKASGETYRVDLKDFVCSCADFKFRHAKGDRLCKHLKAACEAYEVEEPKEQRLPAATEEQAITISQDQIMEELSTELRDEMVRNYVYTVPDYPRKYKNKKGEWKTTTKPGWIQMTATGIEDLAHMVADRYGSIELGEFKFMEAGDRWIAWRDIRLGNFTTTGFADCGKEREFPFRYLGKVVMRNAYRAIVPQLYQDIFTNKMKEMMRGQLRELLGDAEQKLEKPIAELSDGELARTLELAQKGKLQLPKGEKQQEEQVVDTQTGEVITHDEDLFGEGEEAGAAAPAEAETKQPTGVAPAKPKRDPESVTTINELMAACFQDFKLQPNAVAKELGYKHPKDINERPSVCYQKIAAAKE